MNIHCFAPLFAVHIADGFLDRSWLVAGFVVAGAAALLSVLFERLRTAWTGQELREEEIALLGVMTAAFYVATLIRVPVGPTSVHLLLNGLLGVTLRWRSALAIPVGLFFQAALFGHGGFSTLGVNSCVMALPALLAWGIFAGLHWLPCLRQPWFRGLLVTVSVSVWTLGLLYSVVLLGSNSLLDLDAIDVTWANRLALHPATLVAALAVGVLAAWLEPRLENAPEFPLGLLIGTLAVLATMTINCVVLIYGGEENWRSLALLTFVAHMPIAVVEGVILGFTVGFLAKVKPSLLGWQVARQQVCDMPLSMSETDGKEAEEASLSAAERVTAR